MKIEEVNLELVRITSNSQTSFEVVAGLSSGYEVVGVLVTTASAQNAKFMDGGADKTYAVNFMLSTRNVRLGLVSLEGVLEGVINDGLAVDHEIVTNAVLAGYDDKGIAIISAQINITIGSEIDG
jgi:hypothetical protein